MKYRPTAKIPRLMVEIGPEMRIFTLEGALPNQLYLRTPRSAPNLQPGSRHPRPIHMSGKRRNVQQSDDADAEQDSIGHSVD